MRTFSSMEEVAAAAGQEIGVSDWLQITQERVDQFAEATGDRQWIHVDPDRAASGPFGGTIAHGYLTLSLLPLFGSQVFLLETPGPKLNYGANKVRFPNPVPVGARLRGRLRFGDVTPIAGGQQLQMHWLIEAEGQSKPACVAETVAVLLH